MLASVAIVGRANVGKSSLFNAICGERVAIVDPTPGVTRDRIAREVALGGRAFELVDTGGFGMESAEEILADVEMQIEIAIAQAELVLLVVDAQAGVQPLDKTIARRLRETEKQIIVVANKSERRRDAESAVEFYELGLGDPTRTSAEHRQGIGELSERILDALPDLEQVPSRPEPLKLAIVGRRNVGKSTLINYLAQEPRVVVSELPGTTRDSVDVHFQMGDLHFVAIDTAGVRKRKQLSESVDFYSRVRTDQAIRRADVVVHIMDACSEISKVDKQLAAQVIANYKPCVIALNKMDMVPQEADEGFPEYLWWQLPGMRFAPLAFISALTGENVFAVVKTAQNLRDQAATRVKTSQLNQAMQQITTRRRPLSKGNRPGSVLYATQVDVLPPTIALFVNDSARVTESYERYLANQLRSQLAFSHVPIRFVVRRRKRTPQQERGRG